MMESSSQSSPDTTEVAPDKVGRPEGSTCNATGYIVNVTSVPITLGSASSNCGWDNKPPETVAVGATGMWSCSDPWDAGFTVEYNLSLDGLDYLIRMHGNVPALAPNDFEFLLEPDQAKVVVVQGGSETGWDPKITWTVR
jgi:hypothetical protein